MERKPCKNIPWNHGWTWCRISSINSITQGTLVRARSSGSAKKVLQTGPVQKFRGRVDDVSLLYITQIYRYMQWGVLGLKITFTPALFSLLSKSLMLLMEEILHRLGCIKPLKIMGHLPYHLVQDFVHQQYHPKLQQNYYDCPAIRWSSQIHWTETNKKEMIEHHQHLTFSDFLSLNLAVFFPLRIASSQNARKIYKTHTHTQHWYHDDKRPLQTCFSIWE